MGSGAKRPAGQDLHRDDRSTATGAGAAAPAPGVAGVGCPATRALAEHSCGLFQKDLRVGVCLKSC